MDSVKPNLSEELDTKIHKRVKQRWSVFHRREQAKRKRKNNLHRRVDRGSAVS
jgi:hypothetical protein